MKERRLLDALLRSSGIGKTMDTMENQRKLLVIELNGESLSNLPVNKKNVEQNFPLREHSSP